SSCPEFLLSSGSAGQNVVVTQSATKSVQLGQTVNINCKVSTQVAQYSGSKYYLAWYHQKTGEAPKALIYLTSDRLSGISSRLSGKAARNLHPQPVRTSSDTGAPEDAPVQSGKPPSEDAVRDAGSNLKPFTCSVCNTSFSLRNTLVNHMRVHTGEKPFSCSVCAKKFTNKANVITHMAVHSEEKPFKCNVCDKRFTWHSQVKKHKCVAESSKTKSDGRQVEVTPSVFLSVFNLA
uniref:Zinc finger protein 205-like n=1 Tax=Haplochromis burtoni TaxID=8153 RepID=A0A3Q2XE19_HAPBU